MQLSLLPAESFGVPRLSSETEKEEIETNMPEAIVAKYFERFNRIVMPMYGGTVRGYYASYGGYVNIVHEQTRIRGHSALMLYDSEDLSTLKFVEHIRAHFTCAVCNVLLLESFSTFQFMVSETYVQQRRFVDVRAQRNRALALCNACVETNSGNLTNDWMMELATKKNLVRPWGVTLDGFDGTDESHAVVPRKDCTYLLNEAGLVPQRENSNHKHEFCKKCGSVLELGTCKDSACERITKQVRSAAMYLRQPVVVCKTCNRTHVTKECK
jgi:hypothetical protein